jgi:hypothetical protein
MLPTRTKSARVGCLVSLLLGLAGAILLVNRYQAMTSCIGKQPPLTSFGITIDPSQNQQFVEQSRKFAYRHSFRFDTADFDQPLGDVRIHMVGKDVEVIVRTSSNQGGYDIGFYNYDCIHPNLASEIGDVVGDYKSFVSEIPNVMISAER